MSARPRACARSMVGSPARSARAAKGGRGARLIDVTTNAAVPLSTRSIPLFAATPADGITHTLHGNASAAALYQVAGPATIRVEALKHVDSGTTTAEAVWALKFRFKKVSD
ncbi:hypothetical protein [Streptomyces sp. DT203]|uniref:hypothetical protein n=1 Tax=Streptomyces sp. DT203 TaxID=3393424 RepID=UPI003CECE573